MKKLKAEQKERNSVVQSFKCKTCKKRPIEIYQLDKEVCCDCWQAECFLSFVDQIVTPTY